MNKAQLRWHRISNWEYWPSWLIYAPLMPVLVYYLLRARSWFIFNAANPGIESGGFVMESKKKIYDQIPPRHIPAALYVSPHTSMEKIVRDMQQEKIAFPCICKPDVGLRGMVVAKIQDAAALERYSKNMEVPFLVQEFVAHPEEAGIFYCRYPGSEKGFISGVVYKELPQVTGDGVHSIEELIRKDARLAMQLDAIRKSEGHRFHEVLREGEVYALSPYGNHSRGARFVDASARADEELTEQMDRICKEVPGFYFGRLDIRFNNWDDLRAGKNFCIIELNGSGSEPTHMYDPKYKLWDAWRIILQHWQILFRISSANNQSGTAYYGLADSYRLLLAHHQYMAQLKVMHEVI